MTGATQFGEPRAFPARDADRRVLRLGLLGAVTMFLVHPPADLWMLAWLAPIPWLILARDGVGTARHPWGRLWLAGLLHWLLTIHWLRLPHPATSLGWLALSAYLAAYLPLFIWGTRRLMTRYRWPLLAAAPVVWMGCEQFSISEKWMGCLPILTSAVSDTPFCSASHLTISRCPPLHAW